MFLKSSLYSASLRGGAGVCVLLAALACNSNTAPNSASPAGGASAGGASAGGSSTSAASNSPGAAASPETVSQIQQIVNAGRLADLRWPDFSDYRDRVKAFYEPAAYGPAWIRDNQPTSQARAMIEVLQQADDKGLNAEDYDGSRWPARLSQLSQPAAAAQFDAALTVCAMRYVSDIHVGRINPEHFKFGLTEKATAYELPQFVRDRLANGQDLKASLDEVEPPFPGYKRTLAALRQYRELAAKDHPESLPASAKSIEPGNTYAGVPRLTALLRLVGDLPADAVVPSGDVYQQPLVDAVKRFQQRHGIPPDGRLGAQTLKQLNTPLSDRVEKLRLTLERWRWVPHSFSRAPILVNIPEFRLRAYDSGSANKVVLSMNVIVGKAYRHQTPVFSQDMRYVVFKPYWNVPPSIQRSEIVPAIQRDRNYIAKKNYEVTTQTGQVVTSGTISDDVLQQLKSGKLAVRQKPGPTNALGLVKLIFPNEHNVYLHSTPSQQLFSQSRRDFSHGCIRVEKPAELAAWALQDNKDWTLDKVKAAMQTGQDNNQVNLASPIPVLILYGTAVPSEDGSVSFFDDIYGHDAELKTALAKGYPYP